MQRAVRRGLALRILAAPRHAGVDETSFQKRHEDGTVVSDLERGVVVHAADNRGREALDGFWTRLMAGQRAQTEAVAMDFWEPYIQCGGLDLHPAGR
ncbi:MAG: transposase [Candidatus Eisenbacteria bacterium]